jgi:hypothetical protein
MYQVYEANTGKRRYVGSSFSIANQIKETLERKGICSVWVFLP